MPTVSIVAQTMGEAKRSVALALIGSALIIGGLMVERLWYSAAHEAAAKRHASAQALAGAVRLADFALTSSARMAVATADRRWVGAVDVARTIFDGERYRRHTDLLATATAEFAAVTVAAAQDELAALKVRAVSIGMAVLAGALLLGLTLWQRLSRRLAQSRSVFLDAENRIQRLASSDLLTGLANRAALHDGMATAMERALRDGQRLAVLMLDLDRFKPVNDRHGHMIGDLVLKEVAHRLARCLRSGELQARYGGDEFVVVIEENGDPAVVRAVADRIARAVAAPMAIDQLQLHIGLSIGVACYPDDGSSSDELLRKADSALYRAKAERRGSVCFYDRRLDEQVAERDALERAMRAGIEQGEFLPYYQPIVDLATRQVQSLELLCPWKHPQRGLLAPADFIPLAESSGLIGPMTWSVLHQACADLARFPAHWRLSVNIAPQQILDTSLVPQLLAVLARHAIPPRRLDIELTETALVSDTAGARRVMQAMKEAGITVTLDDFGTGYSSLSYLAEMTFDKIKIDRSFVRTLHERPESAKIVDAVIGLSRSLGVQTVAEGVETEGDAAALRALGCTLAQGYLFGRPLPAHEIMRATEPVVA